MFETMIGHSFKCVSEQSIQLSPHLQLNTMNVQLQAFDFEDDHFGNGKLRAPQVANVNFWDPGIVLGCFCWKLSKGQESHERPRTVWTGWFHRALRVQFPWPVLPPTIVWVNTNLQIRPLNPLVSTTLPQWNICSLSDQNVHSNSFKHTHIFNERVRKHHQQPTLYKLVERRCHWRTLKILSISDF